MCQYHFMNYPFVSAIVTAKNEEKNIERCLQSIKNQSYPQNKIEIIVVDNKSTDKTKEIVKTFQHPTSNIITMYQKYIYEN